MNEKKTVNRRVLIATVTLCVVLLISLGMTVLNYTLMLDAKDTTIQQKTCK